MTPRWIQLVSCLLLVLLIQPVAAKKKDGPKVTATRVNNEPFGLFYFEDSDTVVFHDLEEASLQCSFDGGERWEAVQGEDGSMVGQVAAVYRHPYDKHRAYALGTIGRIWTTKDQGKTWDPTNIDAIPTPFRPPLSFHGWDSKRVIFEGQDCTGFGCFTRTFYTTDDFKTVLPLRDNVLGCTWAVGHPQFGEYLDVSDEIEDRILCIVPGLKVPFGYANRLIYSDDFFLDDKDGIEVQLEHGRPVTGIISTAAVKKYLVAAAKSQGTDELALYVTDDAKIWHRAEFGGHKIEQDAYTILESTNYSIQVDVLTTDREIGMGVLFTSNSNGTYFTRNIEHTNRNDLGLVDFEKIANIQGIVLVNVVDNWKEVENGSGDKKIISQISFDDGRTFQPLKVGDKDLHLHSVTAFANVGRVFSSPAPGLVMGVGNTGKHLKDYSEGDLHVSDDAGVTWRRALEGPHKYEFGDQGAVILAVPDGSRTDKIRYSIDHGKEWETLDLKDKIYAKMLTTTPDSTSLKFLLVGAVDDGDESESIVYAIDFSGLHERKCGKDDFEKWPARLDEKGEPDCLMGHKQFYTRRKANADCFVDEEFIDPQPIFEPCKCTVEDFECDYNFIRTGDGKNCAPAIPLSYPPSQCQDPSDTYRGPSGWRLIPGNSCIREGGMDLDKEIDRPCGETPGVPADGSITVKKNFFKSKTFGEYYYLERQPSNHGNDETVVMRTKSNELYISHDHGKTWEQPLKDEKITEIIPHPYYSDGAFFLTSGKKGYWTVDRGYTVKPFEAPIQKNEEHISVLGFHPKYKDWLIWTGAADCGTGDCHSEAYISKNRGKNWDLLLRYVQKCEFVSREDREESDELLFCEQFEKENRDNPLQLLSSSNLFADNNVHFTDVVDFATMSEFIIVASRDNENQNSLKASASVDGRVFADAEFPVNLDVPIQKAYTVLDSSTHAVFLHVTVNNMEGSTYGSLIKSNSNGTSYALSLNAVNRNDDGFVDFEKMQGLEGVAVVNVVGNVESMEEKGAVKRLKTMITHNDGAQWTLLSPPAKDVGGKDFGCSVRNGKPTDKCSLHLHGYTERRDPRDTFSSGSAIGLMMGIGNVGEFLEDRDNSDTFLTCDGGITWKSVKKGRYMWEYGDSGSVVVIVPESTPTKVLYYSIDEGDTWEEFQFTDVDMRIDDISTLPSDTSKNFLLWGRELESDDKDKVATINVDFSGLRDRSCRLDENQGDDDDYELWQPSHPLQEDNCLFGHIEQYHRKKPSAQCWNDWRGSHIHSVSHNCTCTRADYECDYNYEPQSDGSCGLVPGLPKPNAIETCYGDPDAVEYWEPTGYRRIPLTTCSGGLNLDHLVSKPCPSKQKEYKKKHGISGVGLFFAIVTPIAVAAAAGYYVYSRWNVKFGEIRLGEEPGSAGGLFSRDFRLIEIPIAIIAGIVAIAKALPLLATSMWRSASGYIRLGRGRGYQRPYLSRASFAARRGDYTSVVEDEDELLGVEDLDGEEDEEA